MKKRLITVDIVLVILSVVCVGLTIALGLVNLTMMLVAVAVLAACVVVGTFGAYALYLQGVKDAGSMRASLLGTIEPVTATIATVVWLGTSFSPAEIVGFVLIIAMVYLTA